LTSPLSPSAAIDQLTQDVGLAVVDIISSPYRGDFAILPTIGIYLAPSLIPAPARMIEALAQWQYRV
jgi:hypothetical protein